MYLYIIYSDACIEPPLPNGRTYTQGPAQARPSSTCAHARRCRRAQEAAPHRSPAERVRHSARRRAEKAHTEANVVTDAVFHAPMFALNAVADQNACAPKPHAVHADQHDSHGLGFRVLGRARSTSPPTRAHSADPFPSHTSARMHNPGRFSHIQING
jgi:hypothetical protein